MAIHTLIAAHSPPALTPFGSCSYLELSVKLITIKYVPTMAIGSSKTQRHSKREGEKERERNACLYSVCVGKLIALSISVLISPIKR